MGPQCRAEAAAVHRANGAASGDPTLSLDPPIIVDDSAPWAPPGSIGRASSGWALWSEADRHPAVIHGGEAPRESVDPGLVAVDLLARRREHVPLGAEPEEVLALGVARLL